MPTIINTKTGQRTPVFPTGPEPKTGLAELVSDIRTGALPPSEIPGYVIYLISRPLALASIAVAVVGVFAALLLTH